ncbi:MAG: hypothetical protein M0R73_03500 [Dehalococcoidia bacterium]|nr:hypothetical protein [Dehalococcoidia bacterium]
MWLPGPYTLMVAEWVVRQGLPIVRGRLVKAPPRDVLFEGEASLERGGEPVRGLLSVTSRGLVFTPFSLRAQRDAMALPFEGIEEVAPVRSRFLGLIPASRNALKVRSTRGIFRFRVDGDDRDLWLRRIEAARSAAADSTPAA